ncbi:hypothetical protein QJS04_geneDACA013770 [Acorus gramineus]|uniref:AAA+ ATPase domain-containing protein n=1 Tax=Acorus gramineus TaxID=55184 RepID=A0AAV9AXU8_ACOGR|nr:hypothetical protein QJS04_geneDACA013770 [Acorus gramineus]
MEEPPPSMPPSPPSFGLPQQIPTSDSSIDPNPNPPLTIKTSISAATTDRSNPISPSISIKLSPESSSYNSPSLISPPSSAFVSALQSPYISPRASLLPSDPPNSAQTDTHPSPPVSYSSRSDDVPSTSYTPPSERYDFSIDPLDQKPKFTPCGVPPSSDPASQQPRISFSFPVPRISFAKSSVSSASNAKLRSCDVYIGFHGHNANLIRLCKWLKSELELQGIASFVADRAKYSDTQSHEIADRIICSAAFGVVVVTETGFLHPLTVEEVRFFAQKKNLIPLLFDTGPDEILRLLERNSYDKEAREAFDGLVRCHEFKLEASDDNWRCCVSKAVNILKAKLGRKSSVVVSSEVSEEFPFPRNKFFVGREKEIAEMERAFFGSNDCGFSDEGFADEESDTVRNPPRGRYISLEMKKCKEPTLEAWIEPVIEIKNKGRSLQKQRSKHHKRSKSGGGGGGGGPNRGISAVICVNGVPGIGKTELALEFAHRYSQRYKAVMWVGGEARYFRQNILNLSVKLGLDVSAESEKERGRIRGFDEQEFDAFQRVKRELFRDVPYLLVIDNLETEKEWWEGKDLHDLIPRNTGATHVVITTRLSKVMSFESMQLPTLSSPESMALMRGWRMKDYPPKESDVLCKFDERLGRLSFGLWVVGSLLSEFSIPPSALFEAVEKISAAASENNNLAFAADDGFFRNNVFLSKLLLFCFAVLDQRSLALQMAYVGAWFAPSPISAAQLAAAANKLPAKKSEWKTCLKMSCLAPQARKDEVESALLLARLGLARRTDDHIQFHPITQAFARRRGGVQTAKATVLGVRKLASPVTCADHVWASAFLVFGFKSEPPLVLLKPVDMVGFIKKTAVPLAVNSYAKFSRCNAALELLKVCTNVLEEAEKSFVSQIQDFRRGGGGARCWRGRLRSNGRGVDEYVWRDVTLLKAALMETRAKLLLRGGLFDGAEELCRTCISIRTVMLGHAHAQTLAAQETLAKLVRLRSKI